MSELLHTEVEDATMTRLRERLVDSAAHEDLLDVAYRLLDSPVGPLLLAATPVGLVRVAFDGREREDAVLSELAAQLSPRILAAPRALDSVAAQLEEYFAGSRRRFDVALDTALARGFRREVIEHLPDVAYGTTASYTDVAELSGRPRAVRAVGTACALNPLPVVLPCHRVLRADGSLGQYAGGPDRKRALLDLEAAR